MAGRPQALDRLDAAQQLPGQGDLVDLGGAVGDAHRLRPHHHGGERHLVRHAEGAVQVHRALGDVVVHLRHRGLDGGDVLADLPVVLVPVDEPGGAQDEQPELLDLDPAVGDLLLGHLHLGQRPEARLPGHRALAHHVERLADLRDGPHRVVDAAAAEPGLRDGERAALVAEEVLGGDADVLVAQVAVRPLAFAADAHVPDGGQARRVGGTMNIDMPS